MTGSKSKIINVTLPQDDPKQRKPDINAAKSTLGWKPLIDLRRGLEETILYFEIFDETIDSYRHFYALPYSVQRDYEVPLIFEVLYEGQLSLLCREEVVTESTPSYNAYPYSYYGGNPYYNQSRARLEYKYYFLDAKGGIQNYNKKKNELLTFFKKNQQQVKQYIKKNHLKHDLMRDLVRITAYYNALLDS